MGMESAIGVWSTIGMGPTMVMGSTMGMASLWQVLILVMLKEQVTQCVQI